MRREKSRISGFTLIEMIISFAVIAIYFIAFMPLIISNFKISQNSKHQYMATVLAQKHIEELKALDDVAINHEISEYEGYTIEKSVAEVEEYEGRLYRIVVKVSLGDKLLETIEATKIIKSRDRYEETEQ